MFYGVEDQLLPEAKTASGVVLDDLDAADEGGGGPDEGGAERHPQRHDEHGQTRAARQLALRQRRRFAGHWLRETRKRYVAKRMIIYV